MLCFNCAGWAGVATFTTADAIDAIWIFPNGDIQLAVFLTNTAFHTFFCIDIKAVNGETVKETVYSTQRTQVSAKWPVYHYRCNEDYNKNCYLPHILPADGILQLRIEDHQRDTSF